ncbi:MAG: hypothetical protein QOE14_2829, partial [Humisphaera sp.]|nr:hypothetical protein [Humisphaera sp.]
ARAAIQPAELKLAVGQGKKLTTDASGASSSAAIKWTSTEPAVAIVYPNGFVIALKPGQAAIRAGADVCRVRVVADDETIVPLSAIQQFKDNREFTVKGRKSVGCELNGKVLGEKRPNRVENPKPLKAESPLEWEIVERAPVVDGSGVLIGHVADPLKTDDGRRVHTAKFNYGMTKVIAGKFYVYAFTLRIKPDEPRRANMLADSIKNGTINTSAWLPLDAVVEKEALLERIGVGEGKLPHLPLGETKFRITGGNPAAYMTNVGQELSIIEDVDFGAHPSDYLRRPSGTVNLLYSVPGFNLGGQSLDSFLISSGAIFKPVRGARTFTMPTYYPPKHPLKGKMAEKTQTFLYGAVEIPGGETIYGWIAREALGDTTR